MRPRAGRELRFRRRRSSLPGLSAHRDPCRDPIDRKLARELHERNVDLLIARKFGAIADERLSFELLFDGSYVVAAGANNPWVRRRKVTLADLARETWTLPHDETPVGVAARQAFRASGLDYPRAGVVTNPALARMSLVASGRFISIFQTSVLRFPAERADINALPLELPLAPVPVGIVTLKKRALSSTAQLFIKFAREVARPLAKHRP